MKLAPRRSTTLRDVATAAGVHVSTVSRVLNPSTRALVNGKTAERVEAVAKELGYAPNRLARGLKTRRSMTVGTLINDITNPVFPFIVRGIEDRLAGGGYTALVVNTDGDQAREQLAYEALLSRQVDGFILATAVRKDPLVERILDAEIPLSLVLRNVDDHRAAAAMADERRGSGLAVRHLLDLGHTEIACVHGPQHVSNGSDRLAGFQEAMEMFGVPWRSELTTEASAFTIDDGELGMAELLDRGESFTAVLAGNDMVAVGCLAQMAERGLRCPQDISVVGVNDMPMADRMSPPLTTLRVPHYELGLHAADLFAEQLEGRRPREITVLQELVVRESTAPPGGRP